MNIRYALVKASGQIVQTGRVPDAFDLHGLVTEDCTPVVIADVEVNDATHWYDRSTETLEEYPPSPGSWATFDFVQRMWIDLRTSEQVAAAFEADKAAASAEIVEWVQGFLDQFTAGYPTQETLAWGAKLAAARHILAGGTDRLIQIEADTLGAPASVLAAKVVAKGEAYEQIVAMASAIRGATQARIAAASDASQLPAILAIAKSAAEAALAQIGVTP